MAKNWAMIFGWIFLALGVLGFIPNPLVGEGAYFHADTMHSVLHLIFGAALLWASYAAPMKTAAVMKWEGIIYLALAILGFVLVGNATGTLLGIAEINGADNWLHLVLGAALLWASMRHRGGVQQM